jgi:hypothetical protein
VLRLLPEEVVIKNEAMLPIDLVQALDEGLEDVFE